MQLRRRLYNCFSLAAEVMNVLVAATVTHECSDGATLYENLTTAAVFVLRVHMQHVVGVDGEGDINLAWNWFPATGRGR